MSLLILEIGRDGIGVKLTFRIFSRTDGFFFKEAIQQKYSIAIALAEAIYQIRD